MKKLVTSLLLSILTGYGCQKPPVQPKPLETIARTESTDSQLSIASFNIQVFGKSKCEKPEVVQALVDIVEDYDITAIQEVRDASEQTIPFFLRKLNESQERFAEVHSPRLGRTDSKENYFFVYNKQKIQYLGKGYTFDDVFDWFECEPFIAYFKAGKFDFVLINIHTKPEDATAEITHLDDVVKDAKERFPGEQDFIVLGDFNADGNYFNENSTNRFKSQEYIWITPNDYDTTVAESSNTYDRIVLTQGTLEDFAGKTGIRKFEFTNSKEVSDHYPIWAVFYTNKDTD